MKRSGSGDGHITRFVVGLAEYLMRTSLYTFFCSIFEMCVAQKSKKDTKSFSF